MSEGAAPKDEGFTMTFTALGEHIDQLGHVNNAVWVQWMEQIAVSHWEAVALPEWQAAYVWVVTRHEIDYRGNIREGESVTARTFIPDAPSGARFDRCVEFIDARGRTVVRSRTTWAMIAQETGRIMRVPAEITARFFVD
ncbi:acyl-CoA thioesterase [Novosphingobium sp. YJ-S2-02]|uniref:Acyl-CoA thioesterase n=1 Tax=Novosphingobium aureum TaxID=2792964 RepID=A0A931HG83_9SPHN|nr:acyl-CoA thioesterase [Novosphingobium aureum]MBH0114771.1 acyl-CoA thioesterase [Novosphingobium aureum]